MGSATYWVAAVATLAIPKPHAINVLLVISEVYARHARAEPTILAAATAPATMASKGMEPVRAMWAFPDRPARAATDHPKEEKDVTTETFAMGKKPVIRYRVIVWRAWI
jgi:hypothetical protein